MNKLRKKNNNATSTYNRFDILCENGNEEYMEVISNRASKEPKPLPVFIQNVVSYPQMRLSIETVLKKLCKTVSNNQIKVNTNTIDAYRRFVYFLEQNNIAYHIYQLKQERAYRVVIKGLYHTILTNDINEAFTEQEFHIQNVVNF